MGPRAVLLLLAAATRLTDAMKILPPSVEDDDDKIVPATAAEGQILATDAGESDDDAGESKDSYALRIGVLWRFVRLDANGDGVVTMEEMQQGDLGQAPGPIGDTILRGMLRACSGEPGSENCTRAQMEATLKAWPAPQARYAAMSILTGSRTYVDIDVGDEHPGDEYRKVESKNGEPVLCGPSAIEGWNAKEGPTCALQGPKCWGGDYLTAWGLHKVCATRGCLCEPTAETKRLSQLALTGALAVTTAQNFSDPNDKMLLPSCGKNWEGEKIVGKLDLSHTSAVEREFIKSASNWLSTRSDVKRAIANAQSDETEVGLFRTGSHQLKKGGPLNGKVCMFAYQQTRSAGDWKTNFMVIDVPFFHGSRKALTMLPAGLVAAYESTRPALFAAWQRSCCSKDFKADLTVITGHSHGGAMAVTHAIDMISNWECDGRDLDTHDIRLITVAPHKHMLSMGLIDKIYSCADQANCLAGNVATLVTEDDLVGDGRYRDFMGLPKPQGMPFQPSVATMMPCPKLPRDIHLRMGRNWWCHGMIVYSELVQELLVDKQGWGSSCGGSCDGINRLVQCNQAVLATNKGCVFANESKLGKPTPCNRWDAAKEKCMCAFDRCTDLTQYGCMI